MDDFIGLSNLINVNNNNPALSPILVDCQKLDRINLLFTVGDIIGIILNRIKQLSPISYRVILVGKHITIGNLPNWENVTTIRDEFVPDRTLFVLTMNINGIDIIRPASYQSWDEYFMYFFKTKEFDRILITHPHLQARLINCSTEEL